MMEKVRVQPKFIREAFTREKGALEEHEAVVRKLRKLKGSTHNYCKESIYKKSPPNFDGP